MQNLFLNSYTQQTYVFIRTYLDACILRFALIIFSLETSPEMGLTMLFGLFLCVFLTQDLVGANNSQDTDFELSSHITRSGKSSKFILYNRQIMTNPETVEAIPGRPGLFTKLKKNKPVKVVIHGWMGSDDKRFCIMSREVLLKKEDINVIIVDWSETGSRNMLYPMARQKVTEVAKVLSEFLDNLHQRLGVRLENVHIVGHSLGAHIAGLTGRMVKRGKIGRITGLDPAGPLFRDDKPDERLSTSSALFVDVIHTCGNFLAMHKPIGHADFYPNSGYFIQPGCGVDVSGACSHGRSYYFYLESVVNRRAFPAVTCPSWNAFKDNKNSCDLRHVVYLGEGLSRSARGSYFLRTNDKAPYGLGVL